MKPDMKNLFDASRQELLDMGLRGNTLLNVGRGAKVLEIVDEKSQHVFDFLIDKSETMSFLPLPSALDSDESNSLSLQALTEHLEEQSGGKRHFDTALQTQLSKKALDTRLLKLNSEAFTFVQEQGVDLLYLATGFIKWFEGETSSKARYAPLVLIPVEIFRTDAGDSYKIRYTEAELGTNLTLASKLKMEFGVQLPHLEEGENGYDLEEYFAQVNQAIAGEKNWAVEEDKIVLSFFSFGKFQMYQDLSDEAWPEGKKPSQNDLVKKLFGEGFESDATTLDSTPMDVNRAEEIRLVLDSDSSQTEAVLAAKTGASLVIQGPPGTGKSQTITNIISQALADNKKILFVAEKMAALDVVKRRLDNCHIGDAVLELHSHKANKKSVLSSLESTLLQHAPVSPERSEDIDRLIYIRDNLDNYCKAVNASIQNTDVTYHDALGYSLSLEKSLTNNAIDLDTLPATNFDLNIWDSHYYRSALSTILEVSDFLEEHQAPTFNLYSSTKLRDFSRANHKQASKTVERLESLQVTITEQVKSLYQTSGGTKELKTFQDIEHAFANLSLLAERPNLNGISLEKDVWNSKGEAIISFALQGIELQEKKSAFSETFVDAALDHNWLAIRGTLMSTGSKWWRFLSSDYRKAKNTYAGMCKTGLKGSAEEWLEQIDAILEYKSAQKEFINSAHAVINVVGDSYKNENADWKAVFKPLQWIYQCYQGLNDGTIDSGFENYLQSTNEIVIDEVALESIADLVNERKQTINEASEVLALEVQDLTVRLEKLDVSNYKVISENIAQFYPLTRFNRLSVKLSEFGLDHWANMAFEWNSKSNLFGDSFRYKYFTFLVNTQYEATDEIKYFDRVEHEKQIEKFTSIDGQLFHFTQEALVKHLYDNLPNPSARGEVETLRREFNKKRRQLPIRSLLNRAGRVIQQIKPVFMMSPMSIATYLEPGTIEFDMVIFDEASQVKVADALGAILRGKQVIVVGDTKQMPPTNFFGKQFIADDEEAEGSLTADMESILGMFLASGTPERMLKWHYRSRHESLIAVSNQEFYDNNLMIFPSSGINPNAKGLNFNYLSETTYDRGGSRNNSGEAQAVAQAVMDHAKSTPDQTLGVVAFSTAQRDAILLEVERLRKTTPKLEFFFNDREDGEDFFVKNLENVQGDERDNIIISIGYGKTNEGRLPMSFGPLNSEGGERRLNVLISRARMCMEVFCNFKADDMPTTDDSPFGVRALKNFLHYAETGDLIKREETGKDPDSPFEEEVISSIRSLGYEVQPQVGCAGFYIDIAVRDPSKPGRYVLAVECDGATYHSSKSARDRDRIRQSVLEGLGWRFHRIWSTDWFRNRHNETLRLEEAIKETLAFYKAHDADTNKTQSLQHISTPKASIERIEVEPKLDQSMYQICKSEELSLVEGDAITDIESVRLAKDIKSIVDIESPIHIKNVGIRLLNATGASRSGSRINRAILNSVEMLISQGLVGSDGEFLLSKSNETVTVRNRSELQNSERKLDLIHELEISKSLVSIVSSAFSIVEKDLMQATLSEFGFMSTSKPMRDSLSRVLDNLVEAQQLFRRGNIYSVTETNGFGSDDEVTSITSEKKPTFEKVVPSTSMEASPKPEIKKRKSKPQELRDLIDDTNVTCNTHQEWESTLFDCDRLPDKFVILDTETTGLQKEDVVIEVGMIKVDRTIRAIEPKSLLINIDKPLSKRIIRITGITDELLLTEGIENSMAMQQVIDFMGNDSVIVAHNAAFDRRLLGQSMQLAGLQINNEWQCTLKLARAAFTDLPKHKLELLKDELNIEVAESHRALPDCWVTLQVLKAAMLGRQSIGGLDIASYGLDNTSLGNEEIKKPAIIPTIETSITVQDIEAVIERVGFKKRYENYVAIKTSEFYWPETGEFLYFMKDTGLPSYIRIMVHPTRDIDNLLALPGVSTTASGTLHHSGLKDFPKKVSSNGKEPIHYGKSINIHGFDNFKVFLDKWIETSELTEIDDSVVLPTVSKLSLKSCRWAEDIFDLDYLPNEFCAYDATTIETVNGKELLGISVFRVDRSAKNILLFQSMLKLEAPIHWKTAKHTSVCEKEVWVNGCNADLVTERLNDFMQGVDLVLVPNVSIVVPVKEKLSFSANIREIEFNSLFSELSIEVNKIPFNKIKIASGNNEEQHLLPSALGLYSKIFSLSSKRPVNDDRLKKLFSELIELDDVVTTSTVPDTSLNDMYFTCDICEQLYEKCSELNIDLPDVGTDITVKGEIIGTGELVWPRKHKAVCLDDDEFSAPDWDIKKASWVKDNLDWLTA